MLTGLITLLFPTSPISRRYARRIFNYLNPLSIDGTRFKLSFEFPSLRVEITDVSTEKERTIKYTITKDRKGTIARGL